MAINRARRIELAAGALAGIVIGSLASWALGSQSIMAAAYGDAGQPEALGARLLHVVALTAAGVAFGVIFRYQPQRYAATLATGLLYGLMLWLLLPMTVVPLLTGQSPTWSAEAASAAFPSMVAYVLFGGLMAVVFHGLVAAVPGWREAAAPRGRRSDAASKHVVIIGGGFAGVSVAQRLEQTVARDPDVHVTLISRSNYLLFTPMLAEVAGGALDAQHISTPIRAALPRTRFRHATVESIDTTTREIQHRVGSGRIETIRYDELVIALGSVPREQVVPGVDEHAITLKSLGDAVRLRNHVLSVLEQADSESDPTERARLLTFVVAGGGFAGTEIVAELLDLVRGVLRYFPHIDPGEPRFVLVHGRDRILPELSPELAAYSKDRLERRGVSCRLGCHVARTDGRVVWLTDGAEVPACTLVWTAGNRPHPLVERLSAEETPSGALLVDETLRVLGTAAVWALGDCGAVPDAYTESGSSPQTAQHAVRQGKCVADNLVASLRGRPLKPFRFRAAGSMVALGRRTAVAELRGRRFSGLLAWLMWRTVYLGKLPGLEKKTRVALDWSIDLLFGRDIVMTSDADRPAAPTDQRSGKAPHLLETASAQKNDMEARP